MKTRNAAPRPISGLTQAALTRVAARNRIAAARASNVSNWKTAILVNTDNGAKAATDPALVADALLIGALLEAAPLFDARKDAFAAGKGATCRDIARWAKERGFASAKQRDFAVKLVEWSKPRQPAVVREVTITPAPVAAPAYRLPAGSVLAVPKLFDVMQKHATLHAGDLKISRKNQDSLCWLVWQGRLVGKIDNGVATVWHSKAGLGTNLNDILALLAEFDIDPLAAAQKYGRLSGRCCSCNRDLTDPASIAAGIGPICAEKF